MLMNLVRRVARASGQAFGGWSESSFEPLENRLVFDAAYVAPDNRSLVQFDTNFGAIVIEMYDDTMPTTVTNFLSYVNSNALDQTFFHRSQHKSAGDGIDILQGGSFYLPLDGSMVPDAPRSVPTGSPITLVDQIYNNVAGTIAMARQSFPNSATSGFFFNLSDNTGLDYRAAEGLNPERRGYAVFGKVIDGLDILQTMFSQQRLTLGDSFGGGAFTDLPVTDHLDDAATQVTAEDLVMLNAANVIDRASFRTNAGSTVTGAANSADVTFISSIGANNASQVFTQDGADFWKYTNLSAVTGAPAVTGNLVTFFDPRTGLKNAVGPSVAGLILFTESDQGAWTFRALTTETSGAVITGKVTVFISTDSIVHVAGMTEAGHLVLYRQAATGTAWEFRDLTTQDLEARGLSTPQFEGDLTSYVTAWNGLNIVGLDGSGQIQVVWWSPGIDNNLWTTSNLSDITGAPTLTGGLTVYLTSWQATNIVGITQDGNVSVTWWLPSFGGNWNTNDLTSQFNGPDLQASTITSYVTTWGATNIAGLDTNGTLFIYWWTPSFTDGAWVVTNLMESLPAGTKPMTGQITGVTSASSTINLVGSAANGDVLRYSWSSLDTIGWLGEDVSYLASIS